VDDTLFQFGHTGRAAAEQEAAAERRAPTVCPLCAQHFSADARFCPFDGEPLAPAPDWDPNLDQLLGTVVDNRYEILRVLGEGGMGVVYEVRHRALGKGFALKALRKDLASDAEIAARFMREARTAASVSHPGLVEITDFGRLDTGQPFFVMELLQGQSLATLIRRGGPIPAARAVDIVRQIVEALGAAHARSIVHRDLKPDNIHISPGPSGTDRVTIVDFGLAKVIGSSRLTRAGMVFGTPHYMSPEQAQGEATDHRADIYALGVVMYEMFTGRVPFEADSYMGVLTKHLYMAPTPPSQLVGAEKLGALEDIILHCLEKKLENRYPSLGELRQDLDLALGASSPEISASHRQRVTPRSLLADALELPGREELALGREPRAKNILPRWFIAALSGLLLLALAGALWLRPPAAGTRLAEPAGVAGALLVQVRSSASVTLPPPSAEPPLAQPSPESASVPASRPPQAPRALDVGQVPGKAQVHSGLRAAAARPAPPAQKKALRPASSEIVDPWAK
jgi:serine/threonine-protein kinase